MSLYKTKAIILRVIRYHEADKILTLLSPDGRIDAIAKGSRKVKSRFGGRLETFCLVDLVLYRGRNLHTVTQANLINAHENIRKDYSRYLLASAAVELASKIAFSGQKEEALFSLVEEMLTYLHSSEKASKLGLLYFDWQVVKILGLLPQLNFNDDLQTVWFNFENGSLYDKPPSRGNSLRLKSLTINFLKSIIRLSFTELDELKPDESTLREFANLTKQYLDYQLQTKLKTRSYIE